LEDDKVYAVTFDMGGTYLKSAIVNDKGEILEGSFNKKPSKSKCSKETIINNIVNLLNLEIRKALDLSLDIVGLGIGIPGPADYEKGILYIPPKLNKYHSLYGVKLKEEIGKKIGVENIIFDSDASLFLRGEKWIGAAKNFNRVIGITLGTGLGSAFMMNGKIIVDSKITPPKGWIGGMKFKNGIVEDFISARGITSRFKQLKKDSSICTVEEIAALASNGDKTAKQVFEELGKTLGKVLKPIATKFKPDCIVLGGQISKSFPLFEVALIQELRALPFEVRVEVANFIELSSLYGAAKLVFSTYLK